MKKIILLYIFVLCNFHLVANQLWQQLNGPYGGSIKTMIYFNGSYYASCEFNQNFGGVWKLLPNNNWINISSGLPKPYVSSFAQIDSTLFAASDTSVMKTTNGGLTWIEASGNLPNNTWVRKLTFHNNILFASIYYGTGMEEIFFSTNKGTTWTATGFSMMSSFNQFFSNGNNLWLATNYGVYLSTNNGLIWTSKSNNIPFSAYVYSIVAKGDTLYCGTSNGVYYSLNGADLWMQAANGLPASNTVVNAFTIKDNYCYAATQMNGVYSTVAGANNWTVSGTGLPQYTNVNTIAFAGNSLAIGTFEGFYLNNSVGGVWTLNNNGLNAAYVRAVYAEGNKIIAGIGTNNGLFISDNGGSSWVQCSGVNSIYVRRIIKAANNHYAATSNGIYVSQDGGYNWTISNSGINGSLYSLAYNGTKFFAGTSSGLFQSNTGSNWTQITSIPSQSVVDIAILGNNIYLISGGLKVYVSNNSGSTWQNQSNGLPVSNPFLQSVVLSDSIAVVSSMYGAYRKTISDTSWVNPNPYQTYIDLLVVNGRHLFATSGSNVFISNDFGKLWYSFDEGIEPYIGSKIQIFTTDSVVYMGSEIGGIWKRNINPEISTTSLSGMPFCSGGSITVGMSTIASYYQGNKFYIQLSDKMGRFINPLKIDSMVSTILPASKTCNLPVNLEQGDNYRIRIVSTNPFVISKEYTANIVINQKVSIQLHPANQSSCIGGNCGFYIGASGSGITYQWQVDNGTGFVNVSNNSTYQGATTEMLLISNILSTMNAYKYRCVVSGYCPPSLTSNFGILNVGLAPNIILHPADTNVCQGTQAKFTTQASGTNLTYQWQCDNSTGVFSNISNNSIYSGVNTNVLMVTNVQNNMNDYKYRCLLSSCLPTNSATLTIMNTPVIAPIYNYTACLNGIATFTAQITGLVAYYQWQVNFGAGFNNIYNGTIYNGTDSNTLVINDVANSMNGYQYRCIITTFCSPYYYQTNTATLWINPNSPVISNQPQNISVCENDKAYFVVSAIGLGLSYQWQYKPSNSWVNVPNSAPFYGADNDTLSIDTVKINFNGYKFRCLLSSCLLSDSVELTVKAKPNVFITSATLLNLCNDDSVTLSCNTLTGWVYNWYYNNQLLGGYHSNTITVYQAGNYKAEVLNLLGCSDTTSTVMVNVFQLPEVNLGKDTIICNDQSLTLYAGNTYLNYLWSNNAINDSIVVNTSNFGTGIHQIWVQVTDSNGCIDMDTIEVNIMNCTNVREVSYKPISIYPIPTKDCLFIDLPCYAVNVQLFSFDGKIIYEANFENTNKITLSTKEYKPGVYLIKLKTIKETKVFRVIKI